MKLDYTKENVYHLPLDITAKRRRSMRSKVIDEQTSKLQEIFDKNGGQKSDDNPNGISIDDCINIYKGLPIEKKLDSEPDVA